MNQGLFILCATWIICGLVLSIVGDFWYIRALGDLMLLSGAASAGMLLIGGKN